MENKFSKLWKFLSFFKLKKFKKQIKKLFFIKSQMKKESNESWDFSSLDYDIKYTPVLVYGFIDIEEGSDNILEEEELKKFELSLYTNGIFELTNLYWPVYGIIVEPGKKIDKSIHSKIKKALKYFTEKYYIYNENIKIGYFNAIKVEDSEGNICFAHLSNYYEQSESEDE